MKIIYYSCSGNAEKIAKYIEKKKKIKSLRIETKKDNPTPGLSMMLSTLLKTNCIIKDNLTEKLEKEKEIYLITPIWAGQLPSPTRTFINKNNFENKKVNIITVQADPEHKGSDKVVEEIKGLIEKTNGIVKKVQAFTGNFYLEKERKVDLDKQLVEQIK